MKPQLPQIDINKDFFETDKRKYWIQPDQLSTARYREYRLLSTEVITNNDIGELMNKVNHMNAVAVGKTNHKTNLERLVDIANSTYNIAVQLQEFGNMHNHNKDKVLRFCALFCNYEGEDITKLDETVISSKIDDWVNHGFDHSGFFLLFAKALPQLAEKFKYIHQNGRVEATQIQKQ